MKQAQLECNGKPSPEVVLVLNPKEAKIVALAMIDYASKHPRKKAVALLAGEMELASMFY